MGVPVFDAEDVERSFYASLFGVKQCDAPLAHEGHCDVTSGEAHWCDGKYFLSVADVEEFLAA